MDGVLFLDSIIVFAYYISFRLDLESVFTNGPFIFFAGRKNPCRGGKQCAIADFFYIILRKRSNACEVSPIPAFFSFANLIDGTIK